MIRIVLIALAVAVASPAFASGRIDALTSGRLYDRLQTPLYNPNYQFVDPVAKKKFQKDFREGRIKLRKRQKRRFLFRTH